MSPPRASYEMKDEAIEMMEEVTGVRLPEGYRRLLADEADRVGSDGEVTRDAAVLVRMNQEFREDCPYGFRWEDGFWWMGDDGAGGFYFIDLRGGGSRVYYVDHENAAESIDDEARISAWDFEAFVAEVRENDERTARMDAEIRAMVAGRKWWQFWIPKEWPPAKGVKR